MIGLARLPWSRFVSVLKLFAEGSGSLEYSWMLLGHKQFNDSLFYIITFLSFFKMVSSKVESFNECLELLNFCLDSHISEIADKIESYKMDDWSTNILSCRGVDAEQIQEVLAAEEEGESGRHSGGDYQKRGDREIRGAYIYFFSEAEIRRICYCDLPVA